VSYSNPANWTLRAKRLILRWRRALPGWKPTLQKSIAAAATARAQWKTMPTRRVATWGGLFALAVISIYAGSAIGQSGTAASADAPGAAADQEEAPAPTAEEMAEFQKFARMIRKRLEGMEYLYKAPRRTRTLHRRLVCEGATPWNENGKSGLSFRLPFVSLEGFHPERLDARLKGEIYDMHDRKVDVDVQASFYKDPEDQTVRGIDVVVLSPESFPRLLDWAKRGHQLPGVAVTVVERADYEPTTVKLEGDTALDRFRSLSRNLERRLDEIEHSLKAERRGRTLQRSLDAATATTWQEGKLTGWRFKVPISPPRKGYEIELVEAELDGNLLGWHGTPLNVDVISPVPPAYDEQPRELEIVLSSPEPLERLVHKAKQRGEPLGSLTIKLTEREIYQEPSPSDPKKMEEGEQQ
jgi:hypothetical protein